jgi:hypothetical protein
VIAVYEIAIFEPNAAGFIFIKKLRKEDFSAFLSLIILILKIRIPDSESGYLIQLSQSDLVESAQT